MIITNKANGKDFPITKEGWDKMSKDQRLRYNVKDSTDDPTHFKPASDKPAVTVENQADKKKSDKTDKAKETPEQK